MRNQAMHFDTLAYSKKLIAVGVPIPQAEAQAEAIGETIDDTLSTKQDLTAMESSLRHDMKEMESRITIKLGSIVVVSLGIFISLQTAMLKLILN